MKEFLEFVLFQTENYILRVSQLIFVLILVIIIKLILMIGKRIEKRLSRKNPKDKGRYHSVLLIFSYFIWVVTIAIALELLGVKLTILIASGAALLVGVGMGLQNIFNDFVSGIFILFEGTLEVGDIIEVDGIVGRVTKITLRNTQVFTRDEYYIIIPNHKFVSGNIINWSHDQEVSRYSISVSVAYGSDTQKVIEVLNSCPNEFKEIAKSPESFARFEEFGDSSLNFKLYFFSNENFIIERIKGDLRLLVDKKFRENNITIPFPQRDLHIKSDLTK